MQKIGKLLVISSIITASMVLFSNQVLADTTSVTCTTGNYGQPNCTTISQVLGAYKPANTGLDPATTAAAVIGFLASTSGAVITWKSRVRVS